MPNSIRVLAVDDDNDALYALENILTSSGYKVTTASNGREACKIADELNPDLVISDVNMPEKSGYELAEFLKADAVLKYCPIILVTSRDDLEDIVQGLQRGADDYLKKPYKKEELLARVQSALRTKALYKELWQVRSERDNLQERLSKHQGYANIIGSAIQMREVYELIEQVKDTSAPVLVTGESGTGKELVAQALHFQSNRKDKPFVVQNCAALNEQLLESELFGHVKGSFTGAVKSKPGLFEVADGGTFFLDELGEMSQALQVKLLRVLQDGSFVPVGGTETRRVSVRVVAATNRDLEKMVKAGTFREDLFYRLNVVRIKLPALKDRKADIPSLITSFFEMFSKRNNQPAKELEPEALHKLVNYSWAGNIRELQNEIERLVILSGNQQIVGVNKLSEHIRCSDTGTVTVLKDNVSLADAVADLEKSMIADALSKFSGNKSEAARQLGVSRSNFIAKVKLYGLDNA